MRNSRNQNSSGEGSPSTETPPGEFDLGFDITPNSTSANDIFSPSPVGGILRRRRVSPAASQRVRRRQQQQQQGNTTAGFSDVIDDFWAGIPDVPADFGLQSEGGYDRRGLRSERREQQIYGGTRRRPDLSERSERVHQKRGVIRRGMKNNYRLYTSREDPGGRRFDNLQQERQRQSLMAAVTGGLTSAFSWYDWVSTTLANFSLQRLTETIYTTYVEPYKLLLIRVRDTVLYLTLCLFIFSCLLIGVTIFSGVLYGLIYYIVIPEMHHRYQLQFNYHAANPLLKVHSEIFHAAQEEHSRIRQKYHHGKSSNSRRRGRKTGTNKNEKRDQDSSTNSEVHVHVWNAPHAPHVTATAGGNTGAAHRGGILHHEGLLGGWPAGPGGGQPQIYGDFGGFGGAPSMMRGGLSSGLTAPAAFINLVSSHDQWECKDREDCDRLNFQKSLRPNLLAKDTVYDMWVDLELPETYQNQHLGMVMVTMDLLTKNSLASSSSNSIDGDSLSHYHNSNYNNRRSKIQKKRKKKKNSMQKEPKQSQESTSSTSHSGESATSCNAKSTTTTCVNSDSQGKEDRTAIVEVDGHVVEEDEIEDDYDNDEEEDVNFHEEMNNRNSPFLGSAPFYHTSEYQVIASSRRAFALTYRSPLIRFLRTTLFALPLTLGLWEETQKVRIRLVDGFRENRKQPLLAVRISLGHPGIQISSGHLEIHTKLEGFRYYMYHWFFSSAAFGTIQIASFLMIFVSSLLLYAIYVMYYTNSNTFESETERNGFVGFGVGQRFGGMTRDAAELDEQRLYWQRKRLAQELDATRKFERNFSDEDREDEIEDEVLEEGERRRRNSEGNHEQFTEEKQRYPVSDTDQNHEGNSIESDLERARRLNAMRNRRNEEMNEFTTATETDEGTGTETEEGVNTET
eukprot:g2163.t1